MDLNGLLSDLETVADAAAADAAGDGDTGSASADTQAAGAAAAGGDVGAATEAGTAAAPPPEIDWQSADARQAMEQFMAEREQQAAYDAEQTRLAGEQQSQFGQVEEALELLGVNPAEFKQYLQAQLGPAVEPMQQIAQQFAAQQAVEWVNGQLGTLGHSHPDLLGDGVDKLADFKTDDGQPMFQPDEVRQQNQQAVLHAASALQQAFGVNEQQALEHAVQAVVARDEQVGRIAVERYRQQLSGVSGAHTDLASGASGAARVTGVESGDEAAFARRWAIENKV